MNILKLITTAVALLVMTFFAAATATGAEDIKTGAVGDKAFILKGTDFLNMALKNESGDTLGRVRDILLGADGTLTYVLVAPAGGTGGNLVPIPYSRGMWKFERDAAVVNNLDKSELEKAPTITLLELDKLNSPEFGTNIHGYYRDAIKQ